MSQRPLFLYWPHVLTWHHQFAKFCLLIVNAEESWLDLHDSGLNPAVAPRAATDYSLIVHHAMDTMRQRIRKCHAYTGAGICGTEVRSGSLIHRYVEVYCLTPEMTSNDKWLCNRYASENNRVLKFTATEKKKKFITDPSFDHRCNGIRHDLASFVDLRDLQGRRTPLSVNLNHERRCLFRKYE